MKIITASTPEQHTYLSNLKKDFYNRLFPLFFMPTYVKELRDFSILEGEPLDEYSFQQMLDIIAALQTIHILLECLLENNVEADHYERFKTNQKILEKNHVYFPFAYEDFKLSDQKPDFSLIKADNNWII